jgi:hypothetical protein
MAVSPDFANRLVFEFKEKSAEIIDTYNLRHLRGTEKMDPATKLAAEFINLAEQSTTNPSVTESMLASEQRMYLTTLEQKVLEITKNQAKNLDGLHAQAFGNTVVSDANWNKTVSSVSKEVDRIAVKNSSLINALTKEEQQHMDNMFASVVDTVRMKHGRDPSAQSAMDAEKAASQDLRTVEKRLEKMATDSIKRRQHEIYGDFNEQLNRYLQSFNEMRKAMKPAEVKKANNQIGLIKKMMRELKTNKRLMRDRNLLQSHIAAIQNQFKVLNEMEGDMTETVSAVAGIFGSTARPSNKRHFSFDGFGAMITAAEIESNHPEAKNPAHIRSMQYFMNQGQTFEQAHESSKVYGFEPNGRVRYMNLDQRVNYLGQAANFTEDSHTLEEDSFPRKLLNAGAVTIGGGAVLTVAGLAVLIGLSRMGSE